MMIPPGVVIKMEVEIKPEVAMIPLVVEMPPEVAEIPPGLLAAEALSNAGELSGQCLSLCIQHAYISTEHEVCAVLGGGD